MKRLGLKGCANALWLPIRPTRTLNCHISMRNRHFEFILNPETDSQVLYEAEEALWKPSPLMLPEDYRI